MKVTDYLERFEAELMDFYNSMVNCTPPERSCLYSILADPVNFIL